MARLDELCSEDSDNVLYGGEQREQWAKLFEYVVTLSFSPQIP